jgi:hypothetical protein
LTSFWIRPRWWAWPSAVARLMARPRKRERERGCSLSRSRTRSRGSPPGSARTRIVRPS